jgi:leader peptidase (prepilin peptidase)/N-methyltransferase
VTPVLPAPLLLALAGVIGLAVGSFLNVVVHRVPAGLSVLRPRSACPACGHLVRERDNVPVLSWLVLRGRCRDCRASIPARYPAVEAGTALLFVLVAARLTDPATLVACLSTAAAGIALALIDLEHGRLPFRVTGVSAAIAVASLGAGWAWTAGDAGAGAAWSDAWPALLGAALWLSVYGGLWLVTSGRGMGLGDVALAPLLGLVLGAVGTAEAVVGLGAGFALGAVVGVALMASTGRRRGARMPFGPFMLAGAALALFVGGSVASAYLSLVGLG